MTLLEFLGVGLVAGWIMGMVRRGQGYGFIGNLLVGVTGSFIGWFLMGFLKVQNPTLLTQVSMAVIGAIVFFFVISLFRRKKRKKKDEDDDE